MANNSFEDKINSLANSPTINFDGSTNFDILGFDFDMFEGKSDCSDALNLLLSDIGTDLNNGLEQYSSTEAVPERPSTSSLDEESLLCKALQAYYGKQTEYDGSSVGNCNFGYHVSPPRSAEESALHNNLRNFHNHSVDLTPIPNNVPLVVPMVDRNHAPHQSTAAALAAAMVAQQQAMKKRKSNNSLKRNVKIARNHEKKEDKEKSVPGACPESLVPEKEKKADEKSNFKEKSTGPVVPVIPAFYAPPPIAASDVRRNLCKLIVNAFHSCDVNKLREVLAQYCCNNEDVVEIHRYEGIQNPHGRNYSRYEGLENILQLWLAVFKSSPDICFDLFNHKTYYDPDWLVVVSCEYTFVGTRIMDVKVAQPLVPATGEGEWDGSNTPSSSVSVSTADSLTSSSSNSLASSLLTSVVKEDSLFNHTNGNQLVVSKQIPPIDGKTDSSHSVPSAIAQPRIYVDTTTPFKQPWQLRYKGRFQVFLDGNQKIYKLEFVFTALEEKLIEMPLSQAFGSHKVTAGSSTVPAST